MVTFSSHYSPSPRKMKRTSLVGGLPVQLTFEEEGVRRRHMQSEVDSSAIGLHVMLNGGGLNSSFSAPDLAQFNEDDCIDLSRSPERLEKQLFRDLQLHNTNRHLQLGVAVVYDGTAPLLAGLTPTATAEAAGGSSKSASTSAAAGVPRSTATAEAAGGSSKSASTSAAAGVSRSTATTAAGGSSKSASTSAAAGVPRVSTAVVAAPPSTLVRAAIVPVAASAPVIATPVSASVSAARAARAATQVHTSSTARAPKRPVGGGLLPTPEASRRITRANAALAEHSSTSGSRADDTATGPATGPATRDDGTESDSSGTSSDHSGTVIPAKRGSSQGGRGKEKKSRNDMRVEELEEQDVDYGSRYDDEDDVDEEVETHFSYCRACMRPATRTDPGVKCSDDLCPTMMHTRCFDGMDIDDDYDAEKGVFKCMLNRDVVPDPLVDICRQEETEEAKLSELIRCLDTIHTVKFLGGVGKMCNVKQAGLTLESFIEDLMKSMHEVMNQYRKQSVQCKCATIVHTWAQYFALDLYQNDRQAVIDRYGALLQEDF